MLSIFTQTSSVTKRYTMGRMGKVVGKAYTPHQCAYGDRKTLTERKAKTIKM